MVESLSILDILRILIFGIGLIVFLLLGVLYPFKENRFTKFRGFHNILLGVINSLLIYLIIPFSLGTIADYCDNNSIGLFNYLKLPSILRFFLSILIFDFIIYWQHRIFHFIPFLWKFHKVHHTDIEFDTSTALRFHPIEILFSFFIKLAFIPILGPGVIDIVVFEILLNFSAMFNHGNFSFSEKIEKIISKFIVTPNFHRCHHSVKKTETNSNFGFFFSFWDELFDSKIFLSSRHQKLMDIGLESYRDIKDQRLTKLLAQPFVEDKTST